MRCLRRRSCPTSVVYAFRRGVCTFAVSNGKHIYYNIVHEVGLQIQQKNTEHKKNDEITKKNIWMHAKNTAILHCHNLIISQSFSFVSKQLP